MSFDSPFQDEVITLGGPDGRDYQCRVLGVFNHEQKNYALLLKLADDGSGESTTIMQLIEKAGQTTLRTIDTAEEFKRVMENIKTQLSDS